MMWAQQASGNAINAAMFTALGLVLAAIITGAWAYLNKGKRDPNVMLNTFIEKVGNDNERLREENEEFQKLVPELRNAAEAVKNHCMQELRDSELRCQEEIKRIREKHDADKRELTATIVQLQVKLYNIEANHQSKGPIE